MLAFINRFRKGSTNLTNINTIPIVIEQQLEMDSDESSVETTSMNNGMETSSFTHINKIHCEQRTNNNTKHPYVIFRKLLENFAPDDIGDLTDFTLSYQLPINDVSKLVQILFEEAIKNPQQAASFVDVIRKQQICIKNDFLGLCTNLIVILRNDNISRNNDGLRKQADGVVTLISELFNQDLLTWQNIEGHFQRLIAYNSKGSIYMIGNMFFSCGEKLIKVMPAGCFKTLYATFQNKCFQISGSNKVSIYDIKGNTYQQISTHELLAKAIEYQSHTQKDNKFTIDDFERIIAQQEPIYENIINHLNSANINKDLDKYVNLIVRQVLKKPTMTKTFTNVLIEMRLIVKKKNQMELTLYDLLQIELTKYLKISRRNLKEERPKMQLKAQNLGNFIGELHKVDLIECSKIEIFLQKLMNKHELREGSLELVYNIIQSCSSHLQITLGTNRLNNYIIQLKRSTNPLNMSSSICEKVNSIKNHHESNINSVEESTVSSLKVNKKNSNDIVVQSSNPPSTAHTSKQLSYKDKLLERLKELHEINDGGDASKSRDLLNAYHEHNQTPVNNKKMSLNYANAIDNLSLENFEDIKIQLKDFQINTSEKVNIFVDSIFQRILNGSDIDAMGAELCNKLYLMSTCSIKSMVLEKVLDLVEQHSVKDDLRVLRSNNDDATADGRISCFTKFVVEFFKVNLLAVNHVHTYMQRLLDLNYISEPSVYIASVLLLSCGTELFNTNHQLGVIKKFVQYLENFCQENITRREIGMNFKKIIELQQNDWQIIKNTTIVNNEINDNQPSTIVPREIQNAEVEIPEYFDAQSSTDESSDEKMMSIIRAILSDPLSTFKYVQEVVKMNDKRCIDLLMVACKKELVKCFETVSLSTGKDELFELINNIQNEEDSQKLKELKIILDCRLDAQRNAILIVKFVGELYNFNLLDSSALVWMEFLLDYDNINENTTECLCKFLITVGPKLICNEQGLELYQTYSKKLFGISKNLVFNMPSHVKKLIDEVIKLT